MSPFDNPAPGFEEGVAFDLDFFHTTGNDVCNIISSENRQLGRFAKISFVEAKILYAFCRFRPCNNNVIHRFLQQFHIVRVCSAHDKRQRDSTLVDKNAAFCSIFFPDQLDWARRMQVQVALSP